MDDLKSLVTKVNQATKDSPIFFVTNDPERALGLENLLDHYHIVCSDHSQIVDYMLEENKKLFCLEKEVGNGDHVMRNSNRILKHEKTMDYINSHSVRGKRNVIVFKVAPNIERTSNENGMKLLNTTSELNNRFELKISQYEQINDLPINVPETFIITLKKCDFEEIKRRLGEHFVLQFNRGHTGGGTTIIKSENQLEEIKKKFPDRQVRIAKYIEGPTFTINACVTKFGIVYGGLSYQITGIPFCTSNEGATVGNDWEFVKNYPESIRSQIYNYTRIIGEKMKKEGFKGMFGIDFVVDSDKQNVFLIEINARQPASIPMHSKLMILEGYLPLNLIAIAEFLELDYEIDIEDYNRRANKIFDAAQIFIRNIEKSSIQIFDEIPNGIYRLMGDNSAFDWSEGHPQKKSGVIYLDENADKPLIFQNKAYAVDGIDKGGMLITTMPNNRIVKKNYEIGRIQTLQGMMEKDNWVYQWVRMVVEGVRDNVKFKII